MKRTEFDGRFAATADNWLEPATLDRVNELAFAWLADYSADDPNIEQLVKSAFDHANNSL